MGQRNAKVSYQRFLGIFEPALSAYIKQCLKHQNDAGIGSKTIVKAAADFALAPGKRLRPYIAYQTALSLGASKTDAARLAIAMELFHDFALVHDDIMDQSDSRRGRPTLHRLFESEHKHLRRKGDAKSAGESLAILAGDLLYVWSDGAIHRISPSRITSGLMNGWDTMRQEVILGQSLDLQFGYLTNTPKKSDLMHMLALKSGRYSIGRPMLLGLALAGRRVSDQQILSLVESLGVAFQIQDDVLSTFGGIKSVGKSLDSDVREGKMTLLALETLKRLHTPNERAAWKRGFGQRDAGPKDIQAVRSLMIQTGARDVVQRTCERMFDRSYVNAAQLPVPHAWYDDLITKLRIRTN
jgi:geranylgeranyl diphosphate synthase, type I